MKVKVKLIVGNQSEKEQGPLLKLFVWIWWFSTCTQHTNQTELKLLVAEKAGIDFTA